MRSSALSNSLAALCGVILAALYGIAWMSPGVGMSHGDAAFLSAATQRAIGPFPSLFPAVLRLFALVSERPQWLKLLPMACAAGWLLCAYRLLRRMGCGSTSALVLTGLTAATPGVVFLATHLLPETLFALTVTAALVALLDDRPFSSGLCAGLAALTCGPGVALVAACIATLVVRRRLRGAMLFTAGSMALVAPWLGAVLARGDYKTATILTALHANEKLVVLAGNASWIPAAPFELMTGMASGYAALMTLVLVVWALVRRRQLMPDLFLGFYCVALLTVVHPPERAIAPVLPMVFWIVWRGFRNLRYREAPLAFVLILATLAAGSGLRRLPATLRAGEFPETPEALNDWRETARLFAYMRTNTPASATILANLDRRVSLATGRTAVRGYTADNYQLYYAPAHAVVTPDRLSAAIMENGVDYVVLTPDANLPEAASFHSAVDALARGGVLEPVGVPGLAKEYRLLRTASLKFR